MKRTVPISFFFLIGGASFVNGLLAHGGWSRYVPLAIGSVTLLVGVLMLARQMRATAGADRNSEHRA